MNKQPAVVETTKNKFISAFCQLYKQKPIEKITVQEIVRITGYNRSTFYQYFLDIYDLRDYIEQDILKSLQRISVSDMKAGSSEMYINQMAKLYNEKSEYLGALFGEYGSIRFIDSVKMVMSSRMKEVIPVQIDDSLMPYIQEFILSSVISLFRYWYQNEKNISSQELTSLIHSLITTGAKPAMQKIIQNTLKKEGGVL